MSAANILGHRGRRGWRLGALAGAVMLTACSGSQDEIRTWMDEQAKEVKPRVEPISAPVKFVPRPYQAIGGMEPFGTGKLVTGGRTDAARASALMEAELRRRKEPLEAFPLDGITMVGSLRKEGQQFGLVRADQLLYHVKVGDYLGQNFGRITAISETEISLREVVEDSTGEWIERMATLQIK